MINLTPYVEEIESIINLSARPETVLFNKYLTAAPDVKEIIVLSIIGKLIEQNKRLNARITPR